MDEDILKDKDEKHKDQLPAEATQPGVSSCSSPVKEGRRKQDRLKQEIEVLQKDLQEAKGEAEQLKDRWMRAAAELENFKKRSVREREELLKQAQERVVREFLPVLDNLQRALAHANNTEGAGGLLEGIQMIERQFLSALERLGVTPMEVLHQAFDPGRHEAMIQVESEEHEPNTVVQELEKGYLWHGRLLRPAKVAVSKRKSV